MAESHKDYAAEHATGAHKGNSQAHCYRYNRWGCEDCMVEELAAAGPLTVRERRQWVNADRAMIRLYAYYGFELQQYMRKEMRSR